MASIPGKCGGKGRMQSSTEESFIMQVASEGDVNDSDVKLASYRITLAEFKDFSVVKLATCLSRAQSRC